MIAFVLRGSASVACLVGSLAALTLLPGCGSGSGVGRFVSVHEAHHYFASSGLRTQCEGREPPSLGEWEDLGKPKELVYRFVLCRILVTEGSLAKEMEVEPGEDLSYGLGPK